MAGEATEAIGNLTSELASGAQEVATQAAKSLLDKLMPFIKIGGAVIAVYLIYLIIKAILNLRNRNRIKRIEQNTEAILNILQKQREINKTKIKKRDLEKNKKKTKKSN